MTEKIAEGTTRHLVDPELADFIKLFPLSTITRESLPTVRAMFRDFFPLTPCTDDSPVKRERRKLQPEGPDGHQIEVLVYTPRNRNNDKLPVYLHMHGGGYILPGVENIDARNLRFAEKHHCIIVAPGYRLAPEAPFPAAIEDCYASLKWICEQADELGADTSRIVIGGESAGGGLSASLALLVRDRGEMSLAGQILIYPMLDDRTASTVDASPYTGEFIWTRESNRLGWECLLGQPPGGPDISPYAAAARAENVAGLPPCTLIVGALDLFLEENIAYAQRLLLAGVPTDVRIFSGAFHGFDLAGETTALGQAFFAEVDSALSRYFGNCQ